VLESNTFDVLGERFSNLRSVESRRKLLDYFVRTDRFAHTGLGRAEIENSVLTDCRNIGDFLRIVMETMCRKQGVRRWAEKSPEHALYLPVIKRYIPDALFVHIIRDGRDAALSLVNFDRIQPYFFEGENKLVSRGVYWSWIVQKARAAGRRMGRDYYELRYEDLVEKPHETLAKLGDFIGHDLDYDRIQRAAVGSVSRPQTSFPGAASTEGFKPVGRWKKKYAPEDLARFEAVAGDCLEAAGYALATPPELRSRRLSDRTTAAIYAAQLELRQWIKSGTPLRRLVGRKRRL